MILLLCITADDIFVHHCSSTFRIAAYRSAVGRLARISDGWKERRSGWVTTYHLICAWLV
uniref:Uncharacterized protein n=1 Tax=Onchocerca volvulus TaxID=6282 RepID=A0A8R1XMU7_ONCVO